jgi:hypothetical protein
MATLKVATPFTVRLEPVPPADPEVEARGERAAVAPRDPLMPLTYVFPTPGVYEDVPEEVAAHPYTQPHLEDYEPPPEAEMANTIVMVPVEEPPPTQEEADALLTEEQRTVIARQRAAARRHPQQEEHQAS